MLIQQLMTQLSTLKLTGFSEALQEQAHQPKFTELSFEQRLGFLLDREKIYRENKRLQTLKKRATLRQAACLEKIDFHAKRGLDKNKFMTFASGDFIRHHQNILITGSTGCGKTYLACAIADQVCRLGYKAKYLLLPRFLQQLALAHADGSYTRLLAQLFKEDLLILDDFGLTPINPEQRHDLFNLIEDRYQLKSTVITSQLPVSAWHQYLGEPTIADAILDRITENTHRIELNGESMRKKINPQFPQNEKNNNPKTNDN